MQGGDPTQGQSPGRDGVGVLQLRQQERLSPRLHPCQGRLCRGAALPAPVRTAEQPQGYGVVSHHLIMMSLCGMRMGRSLYPCIMQKAISRVAEWSKFQFHSIFQRGVKGLQNATPISINTIVQIVLVHVYTRTLFNDVMMM